MVSSISSSLLSTQQAALRALQGSDSSSTSATTSGTTGSTTTTSLADILFASNDDDDSDDASIFAALIASAKQQISEFEGTTSAGTASTDGSATDVTSTTFMQSLKEKIEGLQASDDTSEMGNAMMAALEAGTLTVTDAATGQQITAWDPDNSDATASTASAVDQSDWSDFLKDHLAREQDGRYVRNDDGSHQDKSTGSSSYFGMVNDSYAYLSWPSTDDTVAANADATAG